MKNWIQDAAGVVRKRFLAALWAGGALIGASPIPVLYKQLRDERHERLFWQDQSDRVVAWMGGFDCHTLDDSAGRRKMICTRDVPASVFTAPPQEDHR
jgi:hypothetical protein